MGCSEVYESSVVLSLPRHSQLAQPWLRSHFRQDLPVKSQTAREVPIVISPVSRGQVCIEFDPPMAIDLEPSLELLV